MLLICKKVTNILCTLAKGKGEKNMDSSKKKKLFRASLTAVMLLSIPVVTPSLAADGVVLAGGSGNRAGGINSAVSGGDNNKASGEKSSVSGGYNNQAAGTQASVTGGFMNTSSGNNASVTGGRTQYGIGSRRFCSRWIQ